MPTNPISTGTIDTLPIVLTASDTIYPDDRQGTLARIDNLPPGTSVDGVFFFQINGEYFRRVISGPLSAVSCGIFPDGGDQSAAITTALIAGVKTIVFDEVSGGEFLVENTPSIPSGTVFKFYNKNRIVGSGVLTGLLIDAPYNIDILDPAITLTNCTPIGDRWSPVWFGAKGDGIVDDAPAFQKFLDLSTALNGGVADFPMKKSYYFQTDLLIKNFYDGYVPQLIINGNGCTLYAVGEGRIVLKKTVSDQSTADFTVNSRLIINSLNFYGEDNGLQTGILLQATYGSQINNCTFRNLYDAVNLQFCLNARLTQNYYFGISNVADMIGDGTWTGATGNNSQSNQTVVSQNRYYCKAGQSSAVTVLRSSNVVLEDCIFEGANPQTNVIFTATDSTTVQTFSVLRPHIENTPSECSFSLTPRGGIIIIDGPWFQTAHTLTEITQNTYGYSTLLIKNVPYIPSATNLLSQRAETFAYVEWALDNWTWSISGTPKAFLDTLFVIDADHTLPHYRHLSLASNYSSHMWADYGMLGGIVSTDNSIIFNKPFYCRTLMYLDQPNTFIHLSNSSYIQFTQNTALILNSGSTAQRVQENNSIRVNTDNNVFEGRIAGSWHQLNNVPLILDEFTIGDSGKPGPGGTTYTNAALIGKNRKDFALFIDGLKIAYNKSDRISYLLDNEPSMTGTITLLNSSTWISDQVISILRGS